MPPEGVPLDPARTILRFEEIEVVVRAFVEAGVRVVRVTGGEPLVRKGIVDLLARLGRIETPSGDRLRLALSTNGERLAPLADAVVRAGVRRINVSVDSLDPARFRTITRRGSLDRVRAGLRAVCGRPGVTVKTNTVAIAGFNDDELARIARWAWSLGAVPRFIELMPMASGRLFVPGRLMDAATIRARLAAELEARLEPVPGPEGAGPARYERVVDRATGRTMGIVGIISPMTENFCAGCNRVRLDSRGRLHGCLGADDTVDLRAALAAGGPAGVRAAIDRALARKPAGHRFARDGTGGPRKSMISIGG